MKSKDVMRVTIVAAFAACGLFASLARAEEPAAQNNSQDTVRIQAQHRDGTAMPPQTPGQVKKMVDQSKVSLPDLIQSAERKTGGKAINASLMEWRCISDSVMSGTSNGDVPQNDLINIDPSQPVALVVCVNNDKVTEAIVCCKTGKIIGTKETSQYEHGKSAYMSGKNIHGSRRFAWNKAARRWQKVSDLMKKPVHAQDSDEHIAEIKDLVIDPDGGRVMYEVVEFYGKMGHGNRWYAVPLCVAKLSEDYKTVDMEYTSAEVNNANGFDRASWPNFGDENWATQVYKAYGEKPYWKHGRKHGRGENFSKVSSTDANEDKAANSADDTQSADGRLKRNGMQYPQRWQKATDLVGKVVRNPSTNEELGNLKDIVIDPDTGRILYGVLSYGGVLGLGDKLFAIPWSSLELASDYKSIHLSVDKERLKSAEGFSESSWPDMADQRWAEKTHDYYGRPRYWEVEVDVDDDN